MLMNAFHFLMYFCGCPNPTALEDTPVATCFEDFGQVVRLIGQRVFSTGTTKNTIAVPVGNPDLLATWTALKAAVDGTKIALSPIFGDPNHEAGEIREFGSGNQVPGGIPIAKGFDPSTFTAQIYRQPQNVIKSIKKWACEPNMGVWLVNQAGDIGGISDDSDNPTTIYPIPIHSFSVGDKVLGGWENVDMNTLRFLFPEGWSDNFYHLKPAFNATTDL